MKNLQFFVPRSGKINVDKIDHDHDTIVAALDDVRKNIDNPEYRTVKKAREVEICYWPISKMKSA